MSELKTIEASERPWSFEDIARMLGDLGVNESDVIVAHVRMSALGWVSGGAQAVVMGLLKAVGETGTVIMPAHSGANSDPGQWGNPPVPEEWWEPIRQSMPAFDPLMTPTRGIGSVAELFRTWPGARRSSHHSCSFSAIGLHAESITSSHRSLQPFADDSALANAYRLDAKVLLVGIGHERNSSMHLGEARSGVVPATRQGGSVMADGVRKWVWYDDLEMDSDRFPEIGAAFESEGGKVTRGRVCQADAMLLRQRDIVDFTASYLRRMKERAEGR